MNLNPLKFIKRKRHARPTAHQPGQFLLARANLSYLFFAALLVLICARSVVIQLFPPSAKRLQGIANRQYSHEVELAPYRGGIYDRRGEPMAISTRTPSLAVNPRLFRPNEAEVRKLAALIRLPESRIRSITRRPNYFAWLKRKVSPDVADRVMNMNLAGVSRIYEPSRFYPTGRSAAHLLGNVGMDNFGLMGLERQYEKELRGRSQKVLQLRDARRKTIFLDSPYAAPEEPGHNLYLTIDRAIQEIAETALVEGVRRAKAVAGYAIVADPHTGRILAVANTPSFDLNDTEKFNIAMIRNRALTDSFEPGSVLKPFVIGAALSEDKTTIDEEHDCENGTYRSGGIRFRDSHPNGILTTAGTLIESSNICTFKIAMRLGNEGLFSVYKNMGFTTGEMSLRFPGEGFGRLASWEKWRPIEFATISFGQGLMVTALEIVQGYGAIANGGNLMKPYMVERVETAKGTILRSEASEVVRAVMPPQTAKALRETLERVVLEGSGTKAATERYTTAGKTGTAEKVDPLTKGYSATKRLASFVGFAPARDPHLVIYVAIDEPGERPYYGGTWAAPVFSEIVNESLKYLNVAPDKAESEHRPKVAVGPKNEHRILD